MNVHTKPAKPRAAPAPEPEAVARLRRIARGRTSTRIDRGLRELLALYLPADSARAPGAALPAARRPRRRAARRAGPHRRQERAGAAPARPLRPRRGLDRVPPRLSRDGGDRLRRLPVPRHEPPRRRARARCAHAPRSPSTPASTCSCRASSGSCARSASPTRRSISSASMRARELKDYLLPRMLSGDLATHVEGHAVHDREGRRLRHRPRRDGGAQRGRHLAALRREVVLLARRRRRGPDPGAARGRARRHQGPRPVRPAAPARGRHRATATGSCG